MSGTLLLLAAGTIGLAPQGALPGSTQGEPDPAGGPHAFLEVSADRETFFHHETIRLVLRFGFEREFLAERLIQPFQRRLDVPAQLHAPWTAGMACARAMDRSAIPPPGSNKGASFVLDEAVARARRCEQEERGSLTYEVFEIERSFVATCPGELVFPAPYLGYAHATRFRLDAFGERVAEDRRDETLTGSPLTLTVLPLPEAGRPDDFGGAVGRFTVRAEASPAELRVGESLKLMLYVEGEGDLEHFDAPRLDGLEGFRVLGWVEQIEAERRSLTYDLTPVSDHVLAVPGLPFAFFDPGPPAGYRTVRTEPIPLTVHPRRRPPPQDGFGPGEAPLSSPQDLERLVLLVVLPVLALVVWWVWRRRPRTRPAPPVDPAQVRAEVASLRERASAPGIDLAQALAEYLAGRLGCPVPAVIGHDLRARLSAAGVPDERAARAAALLDELVASRYGGNAPPSGPERVSAMVAELEADFQTRPPER